MVLEKLSKHDGMLLGKAAKLIAKQIEHIHVEQKSEETGLIPYHIQQQLHQQYSVMMEKLSQEQKKNLFGMEKRLSERIDPKETSG